jgi:hypothetical protein
VPDREPSAPPCPGMERETGIERSTATRISTTDPRSRTCSPSTCERTTARGRK